MKTKSLAVLMTFLMVAAPALAAAAQPEHAPAPGVSKRIDVLIARLVVCPPARQRFVDNGDGTICDSRTGLMWEKKNATDGVADPGNPHDVDNLYTWSSPDDGDFLDPDGTVFTDFIAKLNGEVAQFVESEQLAGYRDWRLPTLAELQTLHPPICRGTPCLVHPALRPMAPFLYWSQTSLPQDFIGPVHAWGVFFNTDGAIDVAKTLGLHARAVRGGR